MIFAAGPLAPHPDMALGSGRSHMNRCEIIQLLHKKNFCLGLISDLEMALRSLKKHVFGLLEDLEDASRASNGLKMTGTPRPNFYLYFTSLSDYY